MANNITTSPGLKSIDPIQGLVDYVTDIKPYHTKIFEVLFEYVYTDNVDVSMTEFVETIEFNWGGNYSFIVSTVNLGTQQVTVPGNVTTQLKIDDIATIHGTTTSITALSYDSIGNDTVITLQSLPTANPGDTLIVQNIDVTHYYQFTINAAQPSALAPSQSPLAQAQTSTNTIILSIDNSLVVPSFTVVGNATTAVQVGAVFQVQGSTANDGLYVALYAQYEPIANTTTLGVGLPAGSTGVIALSSIGDGLVVPYRYI